MKRTPKHSDVSGPQTVTDFIKLLAGEKAIQIGFTRQLLAPWAGLASWIGYLHLQQLPHLLGKVLPHAPTSNNASNPVDTALTFLIGIMTGAKKLAQVARFRGDEVLRQLLRVDRLASQSTLTRFFQRFEGPGCNLRTFDQLWRWTMERLSSRAEGYTLDLDSTQLLHEDHHHAEGIRTGHTPLGVKRCFNPLLAFLGEAKVVCGFWLRPGNTVTFNNVQAFTLSLLERLPRHIRIGLVRADSGFFYDEWLQLLEQRRLSYIVVGKLYRPIQSLIRRQQVWQKTSVEGTEVCDLVLLEWGWRTARRVILVRHLVAQKKRPGGKLLFDLPGYRFQILVTNLGSGVSAIDVWRRYNGRAGCEGIIKELDAHFGLPQLCLKSFWASEAALSLAVFTYNLCVLFQRHLAWRDRLSASTLRARLFVTAGIWSRAQGRDTLRLAVAPRHQAWWKRLLEKLTSPFPNCNSVESSPASYCPPTG